MSEYVDVQLTELKNDIAEELERLREEIEEMVNPTPVEEETEGDIMPEIDPEGEPIPEPEVETSVEVGEIAEFSLEDKLHLDELYSALGGSDLETIKRAASDIENASINPDQEISIDDILDALDALVVDPVDVDEKAGLIRTVLEDEFSTPIAIPEVAYNVEQIRNHLMTVSPEEDAIYTVFSGEEFAVDTVYYEYDEENEIYVETEDITPQSGKTYYTKTLSDLGVRLLAAFDEILDGRELTTSIIVSVVEDFSEAIASMVDEDDLERYVGIITDEDNQYIPLQPRDIRLNNIRKRLIDIVGNENDIKEAMDQINGIIDAFMDTSLVYNITDAITAYFGEGATVPDAVLPDIPELTDDDVTREIESLEEIIDEEDELDDTDIEDLIPEEETEGTHEDSERSQTVLSSLINDTLVSIVENYDGYITLFNIEDIISDFKDELSGQISESQMEAVENIIRNRALENFDYTSVTDINSSITKQIMDHFAARKIYAETIDTIKLHFKEAAGDTMTLRELQSQLATFDVVSANMLTVDQLTAAKATIREAVIDKLYVDTLNAKLAIIEHAIIDQADIRYAAIEDLSAETARVDLLLADKANINLANVNNAWIENGVIKEAAISDAQIIGVSANKLTAGTIDASNITVTNLNADNITAGTLNGQRIGQGSLSLDKLSEAVYTETEIDGMLDTMQQEIDGAIETFTGSVVPTLNNYPASDWSADDKSKHIGDVYYVVNAGNQADGYCYRFTYDNTSDTYSWVLIKDSDVTAALQRLIDAEGDIDNLQTFESNTSSWISNTDTALNSLKSRTTAVETGLGDKVSTSTFNELSQTVDENSSSITSLTTTVNSKADSSTVTTLSNTVNTVSQKADQNESKISSLETTVESKADGSTVETISHTVSDIEQDLTGFKTTVSSTYATKASVYTKTQTDDLLDDKADSSDLTTLTGRVTTAESNISQNADDITLKVNRTDMYAYYPFTGDTFSDDVDYYELDGIEYVLTSDTAPVDGKDYYTRESVYTDKTAERNLLALLELKVDAENLISEINASAGQIKINSDKLDINLSELRIGVNQVNVPGMFEAASIEEGESFNPYIDYFEYDSTTGEYIKTTDTEPQAGKTYYEYASIDSRIDQLDGQLAITAGGLSSLATTVEQDVQGNIRDISTAINNQILPAINSASEAIQQINNYKGVFDYLNVDSSGLSIYGTALKNEQPTKVSVQITGDRINLNKAGTPVAWLGREDDVANAPYSLYIDKATVVQAVQIGTMAFIPRSNGNMCLKFLG